MKPKTTNRVANLTKTLIEDFKRSEISLSDELLRKVVKEAEGLAALTAYPLLLLPVLAEEKVDGMESWVRRQRQIRAGMDMVLAE